GTGSGSVTAVVRNDGGCPGAPGGFGGPIGSPGGTVRGGGPTGNSGGVGAVGSGRPGPIGAAGYTTLGRCCGSNNRRIATSLSASKTPPSNGWNCATIRNF